VQVKTSRLEEAREWYLTAVDAVPQDGWRGESLCKGWTPSHVVAHVTSGDQLFRAVILDAMGRDRSGEDLPKDFADRQRRFEELATKDGQTLKRKTREESEKTVALVLETIEKQPELMVTVPFGRVPMPVVRALRLNEYIIHGHDLSPAAARELGAPEWFIDRGLGDAITMMSRLHLRSPLKGKAATFHVHRTDGDGEWTLKADNGEAVSEPGHGKGDVAFRGPGEALYWVLMGRARPEDVGVEVLGDQALGSALKEWFPGP
jgi:uncharacterized protein (TIGR03083 family)